MTQIVVDTEKCVGAAQCVLSAPDLFDQDDDGFVLVLEENPAGELARSATTAATLCPSQAITVQD
ncbi:ferredoxin [Saccharopolyspora sp. TS4A08]|uniref:Ferredoxin n=1 Tax=Saccharopolyspora ipomoeae TaxID=3042027 RepID=A0ABT6PWC4_9PSEU|nr:ferredoxin [Saccharopolyspora sp. TS4A08]MDI2032313.1 ferredoxin [Saccharopolyspora sp. TS4A08]